MIPGRKKAEEYNIINTVIKTKKNEKNSLDESMINSKNILLEDFKKKKSRA